MTNMSENLSVKYLVFFFLFDIWFLLILILGNSFLFPIFLIFLPIVFLIFRKELDTQQIQKNYQIFYLWLIFFILLLFSTLHSISLSLSLDGCLTYCSAFLIFTFFLLIKKKFLRINFFLIGFELIALVLMIVSAMITFLPQLAQQLPGTNILHASYGHNHLAAYLLFFLPYIWQQAEKRGKKLIIWPILVSLMIILCFGRLAIFLAFCELMILFFLCVKKIFIHQYLKKTIFIYLIAIIFYSVLSLYLSQSKNFACPFPQFADQLCKPFKQEPRLFYWQQALMIIKNNFLFGTGPGTYVIANRQFLFLPSLYATYVHNDYLQAFANLGFLGGSAFLLLMFYLLFKAVQAVFANQNLKQNQNEKKLFFSLLIGVVVIYFNALFDFDWHFNSIFLLIFVLLAILILSKNTSSLVDQHFNQQFYFQLMIIVFNLFILVIVALFLMNEALIRSGRSNQAFDLFPYFQSQSLIFLAAPLNQVQQKKLANLYQHQSQFLVKLFEKETDDQNKIDLQKKIFTLDPWSGIYFDDFDLYFKNGQFAEAEQELIKLTNFIQEKQITAQYDLLYERRIELADAALQIADHYLEQANFQSAAQLYLLAQRIEEWSLSRHHVPLQLAEINAQTEEFFIALAPANHQRFGQQHEYYLDAYYLLLSNKIKSADWDNFNLLLDQLLQTGEWKRFAIWSDLMPAMVKQTTTLLTATDVHVDLVKKQAALEILTNFWGEYLKKYAHYSTEWPYQTVKKPLLKQLQILIDQQLHLAQSTALKINPQAEALLQAALLIEPADYWFYAQLGNYYLLVKEDELAKQAFSNCLIKFNHQQPDCYLSLEKLNQGNINRDRYYQVSQIIRGEKNWWDF